MDGIQLLHYTKILKGRTVLSDVCLELEKGGIYGFYGHNGSGKTMLLRAVAGLIVPTEGSISVFGKQLNEKICFPGEYGPHYRKRGILAGFYGNEEPAAFGLCAQKNWG